LEHAANRQPLETGWQAHLLKALMKRDHPGSETCKPPGMVQALVELPKVKLCRFLGSITCWHWSKSFPVWPQVSGSFTPKFGSDLQSLSFED